jgi:hypothetical protein
MRKNTMAESEKLKKVSLDFPVSLNGVSYEGEVKVSEEIAAGLADVVDGVRAKEANDAELQAAAAGE